MEPDLGKLRPLESLPTTSASATESPAQPSSPRLPRIDPLPEPGSSRILDFDVETVAAGFADPNWVPQKITCVSWCYVGSDKVESRVCHAEGLYYEPEKRADMIAELLWHIERADILTGHNIVRFDLPIINAECMRLDLPMPESQRIQDTIKLPKSKGFKKGLDNLGYLYKIRNQKLPLSWQQWEEAYAERGWDTIRRRCEVDVVGHKEIRLAQIDRGTLQTKNWRP